MDWEQIAITFIVASPGYLAAIRLWTRDRHVRRAEMGKAQVMDRRDALEGFRLLTEDLRKELVRRDNDCKNHISALRKEHHRDKVELLRRIAELEG